MGGRRFYKRAQLLSLFKRERLHKFRRRFHTRYSTAELMLTCLVEIPTVVQIKTQNVLPLPGPIDYLSQLQVTIRSGLGGQCIPFTLEGHISLLS